MKKYIKASTTSGLIGIWWCSPEGDIWGKVCPLSDGIQDGDYIQYSDRLNHMTLWRQVVQDNVENHDDAESIIRKGYKAYERGRVVYDTRTQVYQITCSSDMFTNSDFRDECIAYFELYGCRYEFVSLSHYYKAELTGNPDVDKFNYEV